MSGPILHLVAFKLNSPAKRATAEKLLNQLASLDGVAELSVVRDLDLHGPSFDLALMSTHLDSAHLARFRADPAHKALALELKPLIASRATVDLPLQATEFADLWRSLFALCPPVTPNSIEG